MKEYHAPQGQINSKITQLQGINYDKTLSPVCKPVTIWTVLSVLSCLTGSSRRERVRRRAIVSYFTREEERCSRSTQIMMKLELISCQASSDATAQLSSEISRTVFDLFTGLPLAGWLLSPVPALKPTCSPSFQGPFCPTMRKYYLLLVVLPNGVLYSAYRQGLYLASFIPGDESNIQSNRITWRATFCL